MKHRAAALVLVAGMLSGAVAPAGAADQPVVLTLDGRPVDRAGGIAVMRGGAVYGDVVDLVKAFDGLLTFENAGSTARVTVNSTTAAFSVGNRSAKIGTNVVTFAAPVFKRNGDIYVPVAAFAQMAGAKTKFDSQRRRMDVLVNTSL